MRKKTELTLEEKRLLMETYVDDDQIREGMLFGYQIEVLEMSRAAKTYLGQKYPGHRFWFSGIIPQTEGKEWTEIWFRADDEEQLYVIRAEEDYREKGLADNYYSRFLRDRYDQWITEILKKGGYPAAVRTSFPYPKGMEMDGTQPRETILAMKQELGRTTEIYMERTDISDRTVQELARSLAAYLKQQKIYGFYQLYVLETVAGDVSKLSFSEKILQDRKWKKKVFQCFDV